MNKILFSEIQRFDQPWMRIPLYLLVIGNILLFSYGLYNQLIIGEPWGNNPMSDTGLIIVAIFTLFIWIGIFLLFQKSKLITNIGTESIQFRYPPFINKDRTIDLNEVKHMEIRKYKPLWEYGGYGIRTSLRRGKAYNVRGNLGLQLYLKSGKKILIGTQRKEQLDWALKKIQKEENSIS